MLKVKNLSVKYGVIPALQDISIEVKDGQIVSLIGANGAGKTTTLKTIMGILKPANGSIVYRDEDITRMSTPQRVRKEICLVPEGRGIFNRLTVRENLLLGAYHRNDEQEINLDLEKSYSLFPRLKERENQIAGTLSGGEQQMLAIARALMAKPKLLLLDEATASLDYESERVIHDNMAQITQGRTVWIVAHRLPTLRLANRILVIERGRLIEVGNHSNLMQQGGRYAALYRAHQVLDLPLSAAINQQTTARSETNRDEPTTYKKHKTKRSSIFR